MKHSETEKVRNGNNGVVGELKSGIRIVYIYITERERLREGEGER